jgi:hypothetical protein
LLHEHAAPRHQRRVVRADTGAVTLIQRFGSAANLNIHLHCLVLDGVYLNGDGAAVFPKRRFFLRTS